MIKNKFNSKLRDHAKTLSPQQVTRDLIGKVYQSFNDLFGSANCIQIGSYPRFTATMPVHDLDILYVMGGWDENNHTPSTALEDLLKEINRQYINPTPYTINKSLQTHSVTVEFFDGSDVVLSVDVVPAYEYGKNEFGQDTYKVPEVIKEKEHAKRKDLYIKLQSEQRDMSWISSDPRGYIKAATDVGQNSDFRKAVKLIKSWKYNLCAQDESLKLKSFHLEQVMTKIFRSNPAIDVFNAVFVFFCGLPDTVNQSNQITDRANNGKYIDDYLSKFTPQQKEKIKQARDSFLMTFELLQEDSSVEDLFSISFYARFGEERFLFDEGIATLTDPGHSDFTLSADSTDKQGNSPRRLNSRGIVDSGRYLKFNKSKSINGCGYLWKVKNDNNAPQPRGEITAHQTMNVPEHTKYRGTHYVECYAVENNTCVASARHNVVIS